MTAAQAPAPPTGAQVAGWVSGQRRLVLVGTRRSADRWLRDHVCAPDGSGPYVLPPGAVVYVTGPIDTVRLRGFDGRRTDLVVLPTAPDLPYYDTQVRPEVDAFRQKIARADAVAPGTTPPVGTLAEQYLAEALTTYEAGVLYREQAARSTAGGNTAGVAAQTVTAAHLFGQATAAAALAAAIHTVCTGPRAVGTLAGLAASRGPTRTAAAGGTDPKGPR